MLLTCLRQIAILTLDELRRITCRRRTLIALLCYLVVITGVVALIDYSQAIVNDALAAIRSSDQKQLALLQILTKLNINNAYPVLMRLASAPAAITILQFFCLIIFPSLITVMSIDLISRDLDRGTLRCLLLHSRREAYYLAKWLAHSIWLSLIYILSMACAFAALNRNTSGQFLATASKSWFAAALAFSPFLGCLLASVVLVSSLCRKPANALAFSQLLWLLLLTAAFYAPALTPFRSDLLLNILAPLEAALLGCSIVLSAWTAALLATGLIVFVYRDV